MAGVVVDSGFIADLFEVGSVGLHAVFGDQNALVVAVEQVEGFQNQVQLQALAHKQTAGQAQVGGGVIGSDERIAAGARQAVVGVVAVLIWIAWGHYVFGASASVSEDSGELPVVEHFLHHGLFAAEGFGVGDPGKHEALTLIGDAQASFGRGVIRVLHHRRDAGDKRILSIVDGFGESV